MTEEYLNLPDSYGGVLAGQILEKILMAEVTDTEQVVLLLLACRDSHLIGSVIIPAPIPLNDESQKIEAEYIDETIQKHIRECINTDPDHNINVIVRRLTPERKLNAPAEASNLAFLFRQMLDQLGNTEL